MAFVRLWLSLDKCGTTPLEVDASRPGVSIVSSVPFGRLKTALPILGPNFRVVVGVARVKLNPETVLEIGRLDIWKKKLCKFSVWTCVERNREQFSTATDSWALASIHFTMSARSPTYDAHTFRDPFQLDRLAEELATRETARPTKQRDDEDDPQFHDLPVHVPLSHDNKFLIASDFNVEEFLLSRSHDTSLPDLRTELRDYLSDLKEELVKLINDDYEAFISLSTDLRDEGARLSKLKSPLGEFKSQVLVSANI